MFNIKEFEYRIEAVTKLIHINRKEEFSNDILKLLAYLFLITKKKKTVRIIHGDCEWLTRYYNEKRFKKHLAFLKNYGIIFPLNYDDGLFKVNLKCLNKFVFNVTATDLSAVDDLAIEQHETTERVNKRNRKAKLKKDLKANKNGFTATEFLHASTNKQKNKYVDTWTSSEHISAPSENPKLQSWKDRAVDTWRSIDFLGYYFHCYKAETGYENAGIKKRKQFEGAKNSIRSLLDEWFDGDRAMFKEYIKWALEYLNESDWEGHDCGVSWVFPYHVRMSVYEKFIKSKTKRVRGKKGRRKLDNHYADNKNWDNNAKN